MHWEMLSSTLGLHPLEAKGGREPMDSKYAINKVIGENEKHIFYFREKTKRTFWPTQYCVLIRSPVFLTTPAPHWVAGVGYR